MGVWFYGRFVKKRFGATNNEIIIPYSNSPGTNYSGAFYFKRKGKMQTDYTKLNDRIVKQAYEFSNLVLTNEMKVRLFQNKIRRAAEMIQARDAVYHQIED
jgi:hypothetical protein